MRPTDDVLCSLPGGEIVRQGYKDLDKGLCTEAALLVSIAALRLRAMGFEVPSIRCTLPLEHALYRLIEARDQIGAHAEYNALIARIVSFENALEALYG